MAPDPRTKGPSGILPMKAVPAEQVPSGDGWAFEIKWDGYRTLAYVDAERRTVRLQSSNLLDATSRYPFLAGLWESVNAKRAVLDGEVVALDPSGRPSFWRLQQGLEPMVYVVFDVLAIDGHDLTGLPLSDRRRLLEQVLDTGPAWRVSTMQIGDGEALAHATEAQGLEGVVAKRLNSVYEPGRRSPAWKKIKHRRRQELVIGGWLPGEGNRSGTFGALLVGHQTDRGRNGPLRYAGRVGTGFDDKLLRSLQATLDRLATDECPFDPPPPNPVRRSARWVRPELVGEVAFTEWTDDGVLRHPAFLGLRDDKDPTDVVRET